MFSFIIREFIVTLISRHEYTNFLYSATENYRITIFDSLLIKSELFFIFNIIFILIREFIVTLISRHEYTNFLYSATENYRITIFDSSLIKSELFFIFNIIFILIREFVALVFIATNTLIFFHYYRKLLNNYLR